MGASALGISTPLGAGMSGFSALRKGLVFLSCSEVAKSRPLPDLKILSLACLASYLSSASSRSSNLGIAFLAGSGALAVNSGLSNVPPSLGKAGSVETGALGASALGASGLGSSFTGAAGSSGALKGLNADMDESNSKSSNSSLNPLLKELFFFSRFSLLSLSLSAMDSVLSPGLNCTAKEESIKSS